MLNVIIESPFAGDELRNIAYAKRCLLDSLNRGEAPLASHLLYTQVLDDRIPAERSQGILAGHAWFKNADLIAVYEDFGISSGMEQAINTANELGIPVEYRVCK